MSGTLRRAENSSNLFFFFMVELQEYTLEITVAYILPSGLPVVPISAAFHATCMLQGRLCKLYTPFLVQHGPTDLDF